MTAEEWDSLQSLLTDDISIKTELLSPTSVSSIEVPEIDTKFFPGVVVEPASVNIVNVPAASTSVLAGNRTGSVINGNAGNVGMVLNSKVHIRPKPISILASSTSLPVSQTGLFLVWCHTNFVTYLLFLLYYFYYYFRDISEHDWSGDAPDSNF